MVTSDEHVCAALAWAEGQGFDLNVFLDVVGSQETADCLPTCLRNFPRFFSVSREFLVSLGLLGVWCVVHLTNTVRSMGGWAKPPLVACPSACSLLAGWFCSLLNCLARSLACFVALMSCLLVLLRGRLLARSLVCLSQIFLLTRSLT